MTLQSYLWGLRIGTIISFAAFCAVIFFTDPVDVGNIAFFLFYLTFFLAITGISILVMTWVWRKMAHSMLTLGELGMAVRQGILIGVLATVLIGMQQAKVLVWWDALLVIGMIFLVEFYFITKQK